MVFEGQRHPDGQCPGPSQLIRKTTGFESFTNSGNRFGFFRTTAAPVFALWQSSCMLISSPGSQEQAVTLTLLEGGFTAIVLGLVFAWPRLGASWFSRIERSLGRLARRKVASVLVVGLSGLGLRLAILPWCPIPIPFVPDDFSFLLASDTFSHGRLTNPTPPMWVHFESIHIDMLPTYMSMYFPTQGLAMAAGKVLFGNPWFGILITSALMCAAICWMLQAWLPPSWAFFGGMLAVVHLGLFSYWINTYHAAGSIAAFGGALVLGGLPRFKRRPSFGSALLMAIGIASMFTTRPFESMLLFIPVAVSLVRWYLTSANRPRPSALLRQTAIPLAVVVAAASWMGYYDYRVFGSPLTLPYAVNRATYAMAPYFAWQKPRPEPAYHHEEMRRFYHEDELADYQRSHSFGGFIKMTLIKAVSGTLYFTGLALLPFFFMARRVFLDRRVRFLVICMGVLTAGMVLEIFLIPHYLAPFTAAIYALGLQGMRHMRVFRPGDQPVGMALVRLTTVVLIVMCVFRLYAQPLHLSFPEWPSSTWNFSWYGPDIFGKDRVAVKRHLESLPGGQIAIVRYSAQHNPQDEWIYNAADIDQSKVIWAREMDPANNRELFQYYKDRKVWLVLPDAHPVAVLPYPSALPLNSETR